MASYVNLLYKESINSKDIFLNEPMKNHTSIKIGGPADLFVKCKTKEDIKKVLKIAREKSLPIYIIGNGSNLLVRDEGYRGIILKPELKEIKIIKEKDYALINVQSGVTLGFLAQKLLQEEITGFEELSRIPGTVGGAVRMNAGAHGKEMKDIVIKTTYIDVQGEEHEITNEQHKFKYRSSFFSQNKNVITDTILKLEYGKKEEIEEKMKGYTTWRKEKQPIEYPNAGSTFKRGDGFVTAALIDEAGLKGYKIGGAQVSEKHAGFIVNTGNATAKDTIELIEYVQKKVYEKFGKKIELEIEVI